MFPNINPTTTSSWKKLEQHAKKGQPSILKFFEKDGDRPKKYGFEVGGFFFDFSKNSVDDEVMRALLDLVDECRLSDAIEAFFTGEKINKTENRAVLHTELRKFSAESEYTDDAKRELGKIESMEKRLSNGDWKGYTGKKITDIVNIGIGGSDLGPKMVTYALKPYWKSITPHFVSNVDIQQLVEELEHLNPETTLFIIASKTFTTQETMANAQSAKKWFLDNGGSEDSIAKHFVAASTNEEAVKAFGIDASNMFLFWDWVGGRYSLWSSIGLSIACSTGFDHFKELLRGAEKMDQHFRNTNFEQNIPVTAALVGIWYNNFLGYESHAILPYDHRLRYLPSYLQQADMESNGKYVDRNGEAVDYQTGPVIWGEPGTNGQHAFYQLIHQGTKIIPCDFIAAVNSSHDHQDHHNKLLANFFAQTEALLTGKNEEKIREELKDRSEEEIQALLPYKTVPGNRPSTSILMEELNPYNLGVLIAFYEHKIFTQGVIWNIYSFDQWGVELGKKLGKPILNSIESGEVGDHDASTSALMQFFQEKRR